MARHEDRRVAGCGDSACSVAGLGGVTACGSTEAESDPRWASQRGAGLRKVPADFTGSFIAFSPRYGSERGPELGRQDAKCWVSPSWAGVGVLGS